jgi:hypothetical protein
MTGEPPQRPDPNVGRQSAPGQGPPPATGQPAGQPGYGAPDDRGSTPGPPGHGAPAGGEGNAVAIVALVLGIIGIVTALFTAGVLGILLGIVAIVLGVLGRRKVRQGRSHEHGGLALGGVITGVVSLVIGLALLIFTIYIVGSLFSNPEFQQQQQELQEQLQGE